MHCIRLSIARIEAPWTIVSKNKLDNHWNERITATAMKSIKHKHVQIYMQVQLMTVSIINLKKCFTFA